VPALLKENNGCLGAAWVSPLDAFGAPKRNGTLGAVAVLCSVLPVLDVPKENGGGLGVAAEVLFSSLVAED